MLASRKVQFARANCYGEASHHRSGHKFRVLALVTVNRIGEETYKASGKIDAYCPPVFAQRDVEIRKRVQADTTRIVIGARKRHGCSSLRMESTVLFAMNSEHAAQGEAVRVNQ